MTRRRQGTGGQRRAGRRLAGLLLSGVLAAVTVQGVAPAAAQEESVSEFITIEGRGFGHGRGLGQWGAFGYATGRSGGPWTFRQILAHYFGDTEVGGIANPLAAVTLLGQRGLPLMVERSAGVTVEGLPETTGAVRATLRADGRYDVERAASCHAGWGAPTVVTGPVRIRAPGTTGDPLDTLRLCRTDGSRVGYRGELVAMGRSFDDADIGLAQTVNLVRLDDFLRGALPLQVPPSWVDIDAGRGRHAVLAQAVASRGFVAAGDGRWHDLHSGLGAGFTTCDTTSCQRYEGVVPEDERTSTVVRDTSGEVRMRGSSLVRTEFTASSGGWTAGGTFPAVADIGDLVAANPNHHWSTVLDRAVIEGRYGLGRLQAIEILERNGMGADGGRVLRLQLVGTATTVALTGAQFRAAFGLRSDWFTVSGTPPRAPVEPRPIDHACPPGDVPPSAFADVDDGSVHRRAIDCVVWWGVASGVSPTAYHPNGEVTRGQMATFIARLLTQTGVTLPADPPDAFGDDDGSLHEDAINALAEMAIVRGVGPDTYAPNRPVDRGQTASLVSRALEELVGPVATDPDDAFVDDAGSVHEGPINVLAHEGIITGVAAGRLEPLRNVRRDQMASLLARGLDLIVDKTSITPPATPSP